MRIIKGTIQNRKVFGFTNGIVTYGKNVFDKYRIEVDTTLGAGSFKTPLYQGNKKPLFRNIPILTALLIIPIIVGWPIGLIATTFELYFKGIKDSISEARSGSFETKDFSLLLSVLLLILFSAYFFVTLFI